MVLAYKAWHDDSLVLGLGVSLGAQRRHELLLRLQHVSNAGLKQPNPGLNFLQLRYALHF